MAESKAMRILLMEDDRTTARLIKGRLESSGYVVDVANDGEKGLAMYASGSYDVLLTDNSMPIHSGLEVISILASRSPLPPTIMVTGSGSERVAVKAIKLGAHDYVVKDMEGGYLDLLPTVIERALQHYRIVEEKQQADETLRAEHEFSQRIIKGSPAIICGIGPDGITRFVNPAGERITGYSAEELIGRNWWNTFYPGDEYKQVEKLFSEMEHRDVVGFEMTLTARDGNKKIIAWNSINQFDKSGNIVEVVGVGDDITNSKQAEEAMREADRLRSIQRLAAGVAHNYNNLMTGIIGYAGFVKKELEKRNIPMDDMAKLLECAEKVALITKQLRISMEPPHSERVSIALGDVIDNLARACRESLPESVKLKANVVTPDATMKVRKEDLHDALLNICINAGEAMKKGGTLSITADKVPREGHKAGFALIGITDTGVGMQPETRASIFEPFFSTKNTVGVGLSLSVTHRVVEDHGGFIEVESSPGKGTRFSVFLPVAPEDETV